MPIPPTPDSGFFVILIQLLRDHWLCALLILIAFILGFFGRGFLGF